MILGMFATMKLNCQRKTCSYWNLQLQFLLSWFTFTQMGFNRKHFVMVLYRLLAMPTNSIIGTLDAIDFLVKGIIPNRVNWLSTFLEDTLSANQSTTF